MILGSPLFGYLAKTLVAKRRLMFAGSILSIISLMPLSMQLPLGTVTLAWLFFAIGLFSSCQVIGYAVITELVSPERSGISLGIASVVTMLCGALGQTGSSHLLHFMTSMTVIKLNAYQIILIGLIILIVISCFIPFFLKQKTDPNKLIQANFDTTT